MKILVLGASGTIGSALYQVLSGAKEYAVYGTFNRNKPDNIREEYWRGYDISDAAELDEILGSIRPDMVISSLTGDFELQMDAHRRVAAYLKDTSGRMIFMSTANVFDGDVRGEHSEDSVPYPISAYGKFKKSCEELLVNALGGKCLTIRLPKIFSTDYAKSLIQQAESGQPIYSNLYMNLNTAPNVAQAVMSCIEIGKSGVLHLISRDRISIGECVNLLQMQCGKSISLRPERLTTESYCNALSCDNSELLRVSEDGNFYLTMISSDEDIALKVGIMCQEIIKKSMGERT